MADNLMRKLPFTRFAMEMRSGKIIEIDEGFVKMLGYTEEDMKNGLVFKDIVPDIDYEGIITELRETFIDQRYACYEHYFQTKTGKKIRVVVFIYWYISYGRRVDVTDSCFSGTSGSAVCFEWT